MLRLLTRCSKVAVALALALVACGVRSNRDMSAPPREITYGDACGLQDYFDQRARAGLGGPIAADEMLATNDKGQTIGEGTYVLRDPLARRRFARLLRDEYSGLDAKVAQAVESTEGKVTVHVRWWDAGQIRRLRDDDVVIASSQGATELPANICVSDFLFGEKVYAMRARYLRNEVNLETGQPLDAPSIDVSDAGPAPTATMAPTATVAPAASSSVVAPAATTSAAIAPSASIAPTASVSAAPNARPK